MTPGARVAAAIEVLDEIIAGNPAEKALTTWARRSRFAGSKDRAAVRDWVFDCLRNWRSDAALGGGETGRAHLIGRLRALYLSEDGVFTGDGYAPAELTVSERAYMPRPMEQAEKWNVQNWMVPYFQGALGADAERAALAMCTRAPITLRVNAAKTSSQDLMDDLYRQGIEANVNSAAQMALTVTKNARRLTSTDEYTRGLFEFQDAASQASVEWLPNAKTALDYCAGGGGKALAMSARGLRVTAHDADASRMKDINVRSKRAGVHINEVPPGGLPKDVTYDIVYVDAPCSGSGTWRRTPEAKWTLTQDKLTQYSLLQFNILSEASEFVGEGGLLSYATCSIFSEENEEVVQSFLQTYPAWSCVRQKRWPVCDTSDGFFTAHLTRR